MEDDAKNEPGPGVEIAHNLHVFKECFVYKIPPLKNESGHRANDWDVNKPLWSGHLRIAARGNALTIYLEDAESAELFAECPVREPGTGASSCEPVTDSSRYFVLRIEDGKGHHQYIGMGFRERPDAYDFNATLADHWKGVRRDREAEAISQQDPASVPALDLKLKPGQMLNINLGQKPRERPAVRRASGDHSNALRSLAPPPLPPPPPATPPQSATAVPLPPPASLAHTPPSAHKLASDEFGDFTSADDSSAGGADGEDDSGFASFQVASPAAS